MRQPYDVASRDALILWACDPNGRPQRLQSFLESYDSINRDIPCFDDMSFGLARLVALGYVTVQKSVKSGITIKVTTKGSKWIKGSRVPTPIDADDGSEAVGRLKGFDQSDYDLALDAYSRSMEKWLRLARILGVALRPLGERAGRDGNNR